MLYAEYSSAHMNCRKQIGLLSFYTYPTPPRCRTRDARSRYLGPVLQHCRERDHSVAHLVLFFPGVLGSSYRAKKNAINFYRQEAPLGYSTTDFFKVPLGTSCL
jgi:hypothetical protein